MKQSRMDFNRQILVIIDNNPSSMHREYHKFYAVHVYLRSIRISLVSAARAQIKKIKKLIHVSKILNIKIFVLRNSVKVGAKEAFNFMHNFRTNYKKRTYSCSNPCITSRCSCTESETRQESNEGNNVANYHQTIVKELLKIFKKHYF